MSAVETTEATTTSNTIPVAVFLQNIHTIDNRIAEIKNITVNINTYAQNANISLDDIPTESVQELIDLTSQKIKESKGTLDALKQSLSSSSAESSDFKLKNNALNTSLRKFAHCVQEFNQAQSLYDKNVKARLKGVLKPILNQTDEEIEQVIDSGEGMDAIRGAMMGNVNSTIKTNVRQVEETYQSILHIQRNMLQVNQMFMDLSTLIEEQGGLIDKIEVNIDKAHTSVKEANKHLKDSIAYQKKNRKLKCWIMIILIIIVAALAIWLTLWL